MDRQLLKGNEQLRLGETALEGATALDFWRWAFADLRQNALRGVFAEWLVARLLGGERACRDPWAECDLVTAQGLRIEVKAAAYRQSWHEQGAAPSRIVFSGLHGRQWHAGGYAETSTYNADLYVFCLLDNLDTAADPFDLSNWRFWLLSAADLGRPTRNSAQRRSITLASVMREGREATAAELPAALRVQPSVFTQSA